MTDVPDVINVISVPIVIVVLNVFLVHNVLYDPHVPNVLIVLIVHDVFFVPDVHYYPYVLSVIYSLFQNFCSFNNHSQCNIKYYLQAVSTAV